MNFEDDTIAAISTPLGQGGIGIVRMSGPGALAIADAIFHAKNGMPVSDARSHALLYGRIQDPRDGRTIDEALVSVMRSPQSYTREDVVEVNCHGGMVAVRTVLELMLHSGARLAEPGEFTKRAFLNGRLSLDEAEAVMDLINARTGESMRLAAEQLQGGLSARLEELKGVLTADCALIEAYIDFPEDEIGQVDRERIGQRLGAVASGLERLIKTFREARFFREGLSVAIVGRPNVGKSSLLNALIKRDRAIVTEIPGTTRDLIEEQLNVGGLPVRVIDTAGIRSSDETVEKEGIRRSLDAMKAADFVILLIDGSEPLTGDDLSLLGSVKNRNAVIAVNKSDLPSRVSLTDLDVYGKRCTALSAVSGAGLEELKSLIIELNIGNWKEEREGLVVTNVRHKAALERASAAVGRVLPLLDAGGPIEIIALEMREALDGIGEITGAVTTEDILNKIFSDFCIGK
jgi:tRNA modification GTPase